MTELESKIWDMTHRWCDAQYGAIPDQNRRYLMDEIKALALSNGVRQSEQLVCDNCETKLKAQYHTPKGIFCIKCKDLTN